MFSLNEVVWAGYRKGSGILQCYRKNLPRRAARIIGQLHEMYLVTLVDPTPEFLATGLPMTESAYQDWIQKGWNLLPWAQVNHLRYQNYHTDNLGQVKRKCQICR